MWHGPLLCISKDLNEINYIIKRILTLCCYDILGHLGRPHHVTVSVWPTPRDVATPQFAALQQQRLHWPNNPMNFSNGICRSQVPSLPPLDCTHDTVCPRLLTPLTDQRLEYSRRLGRLSKVWWRFQPLVSCIFHLRTQWRLEMKTQSTMCRKNIPAFYIFNNSAKNERMLIIFGAQNPEEISHRKIMNSLNSPE